MGLIRLNCTFLRRGIPRGLDGCCRTFFVQRPCLSIFCKLLVLILLGLLALLGFVSARLLVHAYSRLLRLGLLHGYVFPFLLLLVCLFCSGLWNSFLLRTCMRRSLWDAPVGIDTVLKHRLSMGLIRLNCTFLRRGIPRGLDG